MAQATQKQKRLPWDQVFWADWLSDECLAKCTMATVGVWSNCCALMAKSGRTGEYTGTVQELRRATRAASQGELESAIRELCLTGTADVFVELLPEHAQPSDPAELETWESLLKTCEELRGKAAQLPPGRRDLVVGVTLSHCEVTLRNRRQYREHRNREGSRRRKANQRARESQP